MITFRKTSWIFLTSVHLKKWKKEKAHLYKQELLTHTKSQVSSRKSCCFLCQCCCCPSMPPASAKSLCLEPRFRFRSLPWSMGRAGQLKSWSWKGRIFEFHPLTRPTLLNTTKSCFCKLDDENLFLKNLASHENIVLWSILFHKNIQLPMCNKAIPDTKTSHGEVGSTAANPQWKRGLNSQLSKFRTQKVGIVREETIPCWSAKNWIKIGFLEQVKTVFQGKCERKLQYRDFQCCPHFCLQLYFVVLFLDSPFFPCPCCFGCIQQMLESCSWLLTSHILGAPCCFGCIQQMFESS